MRSPVLRLLLCLIKTMERAKLDFRHGKNIFQKRLEVPPHASAKTSIGSRFFFIFISVECNFLSTVSRLMERHHVSHCFESRCHGCARLRTAGLLLKNGTWNTVAAV